MTAGKSILFEIQWDRIVTIVALTWLAAAGPMPAFAMTPAVPTAAVPPPGGH
jgi:hypothetical protein